MSSNPSSVPRRRNYNRISGLKGLWPWQVSSNRKCIGKEARATNDIITSIAFTTTQSSQLTRSISPLWHQAMSQYVENLSADDQRSIVSMKDDSALTTQNLERLFIPLLEQHKRGNVNKLLLTFGSTLRHVRSFATIIDVAVQSHPNVACLIWGGIRLVLEVWWSTDSRFLLNL